MMTQVQVRMPDELLKQLDRWVEEGRFRSRSDAIKTIVAIYEDREKTRQFYMMLEERRREAEEAPDRMVPLG